jgi:hypothetical protein
MQDPRLVVDNENLGHGRSLLFHLATPMANLKVCC